MFGPLDLCCIQVDPKVRYLRELVQALHARSMYCMSGLPTGVENRFAKVGLQSFVSWSLGLLLFEAVTMLLKAETLLTRQTPLLHRRSHTFKKIFNYPLLYLHRTALLTHTQKDQGERPL